MVKGMRIKARPGSAALASGVALVGAGVGGLVGVDRQLEAATPKQGDTRVVSDGDAKRGDCPADKPDKPQPKQSSKL